MYIYVLRRLSNNQVRVVAAFWMKADANSWLNSFPAAKDQYRIHQSNTVFYPGQIINFPEV